MLSFYNNQVFPERKLPYTVRPLIKEDLDQINEIDKEAFPTQWPPANYRQELQNKIAHYIVICDSSRTIAVQAEKSSGNFISRLLHLKKENAAVLPTVPDPRYYIAGFSGIWMMAGEAHVTNIAVRQEYRGRGLGEYLLLATYDLAQSQNASFMTLEVRASNIVAQGLYNKYGFVEMGVRKGYYLDNHEDAVIMSTEAISSPSYQERINRLRDALAKKLHE
jgi:[ribosomal protein S18]-alanine N-acetyltransferase